MKQKLTINLLAILYAYKNEKYNGIVLEGGSRSRKTWSTIEFLIIYCQQNTGKTINILKETFASFKTTLYNDFRKIFGIYGIVSEFDYAKEIKTFKLFGNTINFLGVDKLSKVHGISSDIFWINEGLEIPLSFFDQFEQRCEEFFIADYNPYYTEHEFYKKVASRQDVYFLCTTMLQNPYVPDNQKRKILSYKPTKFNIENGTADEFMWKVYGLGQRGSAKGVIFKNIEYIEKFPNIAYSYGLDFGFTNDPTALVKCAVEGNTIYAELLLYEPISTPELLNDYVIAKGIDVLFPITADSADKYSSSTGTVEMVKGLRQLGWNINKVHKTQNNFFWLLKLRQCKIKVVRNELYQKFKIEFDNYKFKEINGTFINQPIDKYNHAIDALRYDFMGRNVHLGFNYQ